jgi:hypothetical protein
VADAAPRNIEAIREELRDSELEGYPPELPARLAEARMDPVAYEPLIEIALEADDVDIRRFCAGAAARCGEQREALERGLAMTGSEHERRRSVGWYMLEALALRLRYVEEIQNRAVERAPREEGEEALTAYCRLLGVFDSEVFTLIASQYLEHPSDKVALAACLALGFHLNARATEALGRLTTHPNPDIRDWAVFGLRAEDLNGRLRDSAGVRMLLKERAQDPEPFVRANAIEGLAALGDPFAVKALRRELKVQAPAEILLAAGAIAEPALATPLRKLRARLGAGCDPDYAGLVDAILAACEA